MKTILTTAAFAVALSTTAYAEGSMMPSIPALPEITWPEVEVTVGAERELEAEVNTLYSQVGIGAITLGTTLKDTAKDTGAFEISKYEFDVVQPLGPYVSLYVKNDFTNELKHSETVVGGKIKF